MTTFDRLRDVVCGIFNAHPSVVREDVTLAALTGPRDDKRRLLLAEAVFHSFGVAIESDLNDSTTLGAIAETIDGGRARGPQPSGSGVAS